MANLELVCRESRADMGLAMREAQRRKNFYAVARMSFGGEGEKAARRENAAMLAKIGARSPT